MIPATTIEPGTGGRNANSAAAAVVFALTALRALLAPCVIFLATSKAPAWAFATCLIAAFLSDIYDGVIARRFGVATASLRRFDSITDTVFYVAVAYAAWLLYPDVIRSNLVGIAAIVALEAVRYIYDLTKFRRSASYHMWSAKVWGIALFAAFFALFGFGTPALVPVAIGVGIIADLEGLAASLILREWTHDVPSVFHAYSIVKGLPGKAGVDL
jgi:phosphatidylglycerophosphate synthase